MCPTGSGASVLDAGTSGRHPSDGRATHTEQTVKGKRRDEIFRVGRCSDRGGGRCPASGNDACSLTTGDFSGHTSRSVQTLPIGKPVALKMQDGTIYTIIATKL